jgi:iron complex outermembrane receptor protein
MKDLLNALQLYMPKSAMRGGQRHFVRWASSLALIGPALLPAAGMAQSTTAAAPAQASVTQLDEVIVTAQKREQRAIDTPLSVTALDANALADQQIATLTDLAFVSPALRDGEQSGVNRIFIRGIGLTSFSSGADPSVAYYVDGVYIGRPTEQLNTMYDVERIEVLRGPQGSLYGRNATGGAVNVITNAPTAEFSGYIDETAGNYDLHATQGAISGPLNQSGTLLGRVAFDFLNHSGYGWDYGPNNQHPVNDANKQNVRGTLEFKPNDKVDLKIISEFTHEADNDYYTASFGAYPPYVLAGLQGASNPANGGIPAGISISNSQNVADALPDIENHRTGEALTADLTVDLSDSTRFTSITAGRNYLRYNGYNSDDTSAGLGSSLAREWDHQLSQSFALNNHEGAWDSIGGVDLYYEKIKNQTIVPFPQFTNVFFPGPVNYEQSGTMPIYSFAGYAQTTYSIRPDLRLTVGGRFSAEERHSVGYFTGIPPGVTPIDQEKTWRAFTPKAGVEYDVAKDVLLYASATNGFKSGTFDVGQLNPAINPEKVWAYEAGLKAELLDRRVQFTSAVFYYNYKDLQVNKIIGIELLTVNAAAAKNKGIELSTKAKVTEQFTIDGNFSYLDAKFTSFDSTNPVTNVDQNLAGNVLPGAPKVQAGLGATYDFPLQGGALISARAEAEYLSKIYFSEFNVDPLSQSGNTKLNASLKYLSESGKWSAMLWGKNVTNRLTASNKVVTIALWGYPIYGSVDPPATYGITLNYKF